MRTDDLIRAIALDGATEPPSLAGRMLAGLVIGGAVAVALFALVLGVRPDIGAALHTPQFLIKAAIAMTCCVFALWACWRLAKPQVGIRDMLVGLMVAPALLVAAVGYELLMVPSAEWSSRAIGTNARVCLVAVPLLSVAPLIAMLAALRAGAPRSPAMFGAVAGLLSGGIGASLYAMHCPDDSPLFVAIWYTIGVVTVMLVGASAGRSVLRW